MDDPVVIRCDETKEYFFDEGCFILELLNTDQDENASVARARVATGSTTRWHALTDTVERYVIQQGCRLVEVGDDSPTEVGPGDVVIIPAGVRQRIRAVGDSELVFLAICTPRFRLACYQDLEGV